MSHSYSSRPQDAPHNSRKRSRSRSPPPWRKDAQRDSQRPRRDFDPDESRARADRTAQREQMRLNALAESEQVRQWVNQEDEFVLKQAKKKAEIRVREGRGKPIDWLAVTLRVIDGDKGKDTISGFLDDEVPDEDLDVVDPESILEGLGEEELRELEEDINVYIKLEGRKENSEFWKTMKVLTHDRLSNLQPSHNNRSVSSVASDVDKLLSSKTLLELNKLEAQIEAKLNSNEPIDVDYWNELLRSLRIWKAKASLKNTYSKVISSRLETLRRQQREEAETVRKKLEAILGGAKPVVEEGTQTSQPPKPIYRESRPLPYSRDMDPEPLLKLRYEDKALESIDEKDFLRTLAASRRTIQKAGYIPHKAKTTKDSSVSKSLWSTADALEPSASTSLPTGNPATSRFAPLTSDDFSTATLALYEREVARGVSENEEIFTSEEPLPPSTNPLAKIPAAHRPRKPRYFNRVQMGYEWNKYNQTHYDHDNPPPKVVQGYKFNIFYPDLIDKSKAPTYRIEREGGRKRGQSFAPAGEEDTCLIRFVAGPPYEDIAFRIVDKEWDYSAKRERGFKSSFEKGILQLHFQLKKIYYRK